MVQWRERSKHTLILEISLALSRYCVRALTELLAAMDKDHASRLQLEANAAKIREKHSKLSGSRNGRA